MNEKKSRFDALQAIVDEVRGGSAEAELIEATLDSFDNTLVVTDPRKPDNPIVYVNRGFEKITGYSFDEVIGRNCRFLQGGDEQQAGVAKIRAGIEARKQTTALLRNYRKNGEMFWNELHVTPIFNRDNELVLFTGVQNDVTRRETLASERALLDAAIANIDDAVLITDAELEPPGPRIVYVNPAFETLTGYAAHEVLGRDPRFLQGLLTDRAVLDRLRSDLSAGDSFTGETYNYRKDGSAFVMEWHIAPVRLGDTSSIDYFVATQRDVSRRRELERQVIEATASEQRRIARDLHDGIVQELTAAQMMAGNLKKSVRGDELTSKLAELTEHLKQTVKYARNLAHSMHATSLEGSGLMVALEGLTRTLNRTSAVKARFSFEAPVIVTRAERAEHLYRIAQEAANNAVRHAHAETVLISLSGHEREYILSVRDDGVGIPEAALRQGGMGLDNMRYRAKSIGADLTVSAVREGGTLVRCRFTA